MKKLCSQLEPARQNRTGVLDPQVCAQISLSKHDVCHLVIIKVGKAFQGVEHWLRDIVEIERYTIVEVGQSDPDRSVRCELTLPVPESFGPDRLDPEAQTSAAPRLLRDRRAGNDELKWQHRA